jgi:ribosome-binding factor A
MNEEQVFSMPFGESKEVRDLRAKLETAREALKTIASQTCGCNRVADLSWHSDRCPQNKARIALESINAPSS